MATLQLRCWCSPPRSSVSGFSNHLLSSSAFWVFVGIGGEGKFSVLGFEFWKSV